MTADPAGVPEVDTSVRSVFGFSRLLVVGTGSVSVSELPFWIGWLRSSFSDLELRVAVTRSAERFVTRTALALRAEREVVRDAWPEEETGGLPLHAELAEWAEAVVVYPATMNFLARLALGMADTPVMIACQCTTAPIALAPMPPPGGARSAAYTRHVAELESRDNVVVVPARSAARPGRRQDSAVIPPLLDVLKAVGGLRADGPGTPDDRGERDDQGARGERGDRGDRGDRGERGGRDERGEQGERSGPAADGPYSREEPPAAWARV